MVEGSCGHSRFTDACPVCAPNSGLRGCSHGKGHLGAHRRAPSRPVRVGVLGHAPCGFCRQRVGSGGLHCLILEPIVWLSPRGGQGTNEGHSAWCQGEGLQGTGLQAVFPGLEPEQQLQGREEGASR